MPRRGEFELIHDLFKPLSDQAHGLGLTDDAALVAPDPGHDLVATTDMVVEGIHFLPEDPPGDVARKALRVNLSDVAAMGAKPLYYLLTLAAPASLSDAWLEAFAAGLHDDQQRYGVTLVGGDTVSTPGPLSLNIVALGQVRRGMALRRSGAQAGEGIFVSGSIGDAALGLAVARGEFSPPAEIGRALLSRYRVPEPRVTLGPRLVGVARSAIDVSDGLVADLTHITEESRIGAEIRLADVPLSPAAQRMIAGDHDQLVGAITGGDDYELLFTAPIALESWLQRIAAEVGVPITRIGETNTGSGVVVRGPDGREIAITRRGHTHF